MIRENAQIEAQRTWRDQKTSQPGVDGDRSGRARENISTDGSQQVAASGTDRERGDISGRSQQQTPGGIVDRLIKKTVQQIAETEQRLVDLKQELLELKELSANLIDE